MSKKHIETGIVGLEFDVRGFREGINLALRDLETLKRGMQLEGATRGISNINQAIRDVRVDNIEQGIDAISSRFTTLGVIGTTIIAKLTSTFMDMASTFMNTAIFAPMIQGYQEYEMQIAAVQTILANTKKHGTGLEDVMWALEELNDFSDKTIYNFAQMVTSIGSFTTAGVELGVAVDAIKGISGLAAISGSSSEKMASGMYMFSQAIANGSLLMRQWNSIQISGMGGEIFQDELKRTAAIHGVNVDAMIKKEGSFRMTLQKGWVTREILLETLAKFSGDVTEDMLRAQGYGEEAIVEIMDLGKLAMEAATNIKTFSQFQTVLRESIATGWTKTAVAIVGDYEEAVDMYMRINNVLGGVIANAAEARNKQVEFWKAAGGRENMIDAIVTGLENVFEIVDLYREAWREVFKPLKAAHYLAASRGLQQLAHSIKMAGNSATAFKTIIVGVASLLDIAKLLVIALIRPFQDLARWIFSGSGAFLDIVLHVARYLKEFRDAAHVTNFFGEVVKRVVSYFEPLVSYIKQVGSELLTLDVIQDIIKYLSNLEQIPVVEFLLSILKGMDNAEAGVKAFLATVRKVPELQSAFAFLSKINTKNFITWANNLYASIPGLVENLRRLRLQLLSYLELKNINLPDFKTIFGGLIYTIIVLTERWVEFKNKVLASDSVQRFTAWIRSIDGSGIRSFVTSWTEFKNKVLNTESMQRFLAWLKTFDGRRIKDFGKALKEELQNMGQFMSGIGAKLSGMLVTNMDPDEAIEGVDGFLTKIANYISEKGLAVNWPAFFGLLKAGFGFWAARESVAAAQSIQRTFSGGFLSSILTSLFGVGSAKGLSDAISGTFTTLTSTLVTFQNNLKADTLMKIAYAIGVIVASLFVLSLLDSDKVRVGIVAIGLMTANLVGVIALLAKVPTATIAKSAASLILMSTALMIMTISLRALSKIDPEALAIGMAAVGLSLLLMVGVSRTLGSVAGGVERASIAIGILSIGLIGFAQAISIFGKMDIPVLQQGLLYIGIALAELGIFSMLVNGGQLMKASIGIAAMSGSLYLMSLVIQTFADIPWDDQVRGLQGMAITLGILAVSVNLMRGAISGAIALVVVSGALVILAGAMKVLSTISWEGMAVALAGIAGVFIIFGLAGLVLGPMIPILLGIGVAMLLVGLAALSVGAGIFLAAAGLVALGLAAPIVAAGLVIIAGAILTIIPRMATAIANGVVIFIETLAEAGPRIFEAGVNLIVSLLNALEEGFPRISEAISSLVLTLLATLTNAVPNFILSGVALILAILTGIADNAQEIVATGIDIVLNIIKGISEKMADIVSTALEIVTEFIKGMTEGVPDLVKATFEFILMWINAISDSIDEYAPLLGAAVARLATTIVTGLVAALVAGINEVSGAAGSLGQAAIDAITAWIRPGSPSRATMELANLAVDGLLYPLRVRAREVKDGFSKLMENAKEGMDETVRLMNASSFNDAVYRPTIQPVLDMSLANSGMKSFGRGLYSPQLTTLADYDGDISTSGRRQEAAVQKNEYNFVQNNTSPKALTTSEIYRRTNSLLGRVRKSGVYSGE
jgi:tape measure domain-containing protein